MVCRSTCCEDGAITECGCRIRCKWLKKLGRKIKNILCCCCI